MGDTASSRCRVGTGAQAGVTLRFNAGRYLRVPDLTELFGDRGALVGNPNLNSRRASSGMPASDGRGLSGVRMAFLSTRASSRIMREIASSPSRTVSARACL